MKRCTHANLFDVLFADGLSLLYCSYSFRFLFFQTAQFQNLTFIRADLLLESPMAVLILPPAPI